MRKCHPEGLVKSAKELDLFHWLVLPTEEESWFLFLGKRNLESRVPGRNIRETGSAACNFSEHQIILGNIEK